ncbi:MAG TPA: molybdopterin-dependent oxidoreductase [Trebonia sp.]|nr:molybdopterin-dependent oxidoreductase [Trebonia sp.]
MTSGTRGTVPSPGTARPSAWTGAICGLVTAAVAMGVAQLIAGLTTPQASPVVDVGQAVIGGTPLPVKDWATATFGTNDKTFLVGGVLVLLFAFAAVIGVIAVRRLGYGMSGLGVFAVIGLAAVLTRPDATASWIWPTLVGAAAGAVALSLLVNNATKAAAEQTARWEAARPLPALALSGEHPDDGAPAGTGPATVTGSEAPPAAGTTAPADEALPPEKGWIAGSTPDVGVPDKDWDGVPDWMLRTRANSGGRRAFLWTAGLSLAAAAAGEYGGRQLGTRHNVTVAQQAIRFPRPAVAAPPLPAGINPKVAGLSSFITPNGQFYRVDTALILPQVDPKGWTLRIHGMVRREVTITFDQLLKRPLIEDYITLCCVSNPVSGPYIGNAKWLGASLAALLREAGPLAGADQLLCTSADGFTSGTPLTVVMDGRDSLVAVAMNGTALPVAHGFPARLVVPGLYGYVSATKWVTDIEVTTFSRAAAYWVQNGWSQQAPIKTESRIDVPSSGATVGPGPVTVAGVAWAQHKGIAAVEVQVDSGPWQEATLAAVPGLDTWRQWTWEWAAPAPGNHMIQARATDKTGYTQTSAVADVAPNGASGYPSATVTVKQS